MSLWERLVGWRVDPERVAGALAGQLLATFEGTPFERQGTLQFFRVQYMRLVAEYGFPPGMVDEVAGRAWGLLVAAQEAPTVDDGRPFAFYE